MQEKRTKQILSMSQLFTKYVVLLSILVGVGILYIIILAISYLYQPHVGLVVAMLVGTVFFSILIILATIFYYNTIRNTYLDEMFTKTAYNYEALSKSKKKLVKYSNKGIKEFIELNSYIDQMHTAYSNIILTNKTNDYSVFDLEYPNPDDKHLISAKSFQLNIRNFIMANECFRDAVIVFNIDCEPELISDNDYQAVIDGVNKYIPIEEKLYAISERRGAVLVFVPNIDSISFYEEVMRKIIKESMIYEYHPTGVDVIQLHAAMVVYPYSNIDDVIDDLRYADRQGKKINVYLPDRLNRHNSNFNHSTLYLNNMTKVFLEFNRIEINAKDPKAAIKKATSLMKNVRVNLGYENVGSIMKEDMTGLYYCTFDDCDKEENRIFDINATIDPDFVKALEEVADLDHTYYFSKREMASDKVAKFIDAYGIKNGHFFLIEINDVTKGIMFFANKSKDLLINNYGREMLFVFMTYLGCFSKELHEQKRVDSAYLRLRDILRLSEIDMYTIKKEDYQLIYASDALNDGLGGLKIGEPCYKALYHLDAPCEECPLKTSRKMASKLKNIECITSNVLSRRRSPYTTMLVTHQEDQTYNKNRFHNDLMIFSAYSLADRFNGLYAAGVRGSLVLISIDNASELVQEYQNEGYFLRIRLLIEALKNGLKIKFDIFAYSDDTLAIIFNEEGRIDVVSNCEKMFEISQTMSVDAKRFTIKPTFLVFDFPLEYPTPVDFTRHVNRYIKNHPESFNHNNILIAGQHYARPASREAFILNALQDAFAKNQLHSKLLPMILDDDKTIIGGEMLLRLSDEYLNVSIPAFEFIDVARKHGLIYNITSYLIEWLGKTYQQYGITTFKVTGLRHLSLNTEVSFFQEERFLDNIGELMEKYHLPRDFVTLEIPENDLAANYDFYHSIYKRILSYDINLVADNYSGRDLSIDKLKGIGINRIKLAFSLVNKIDKDVSTFNQVKTILSDAAEEGIEACLVGVETQQQHKLLSEFKTKFFRQGYYYGEPMELEEFINRLKQNYNK